MRFSQIACYPQSCSDGSGGGSFEFIALVLPAVGVRKAGSGGPWVRPCLCRIATGWRSSRTPAALSSSQREIFDLPWGRGQVMWCQQPPIFCAFNQAFGSGRKWLSCLLRSFAGCINVRNSNRPRRRQSLLLGLPSRMASVHGNGKRDRFGTITISLFRDRLVSFLSLRTLANAIRRCDHNQI